MNSREQGPFCQSCAMPMHKPEDFGIEANGIRSNDYCTYCYQEGAFVQPDITREGMIDFCTNILMEKGIMPKEQASIMLKQTIPNLKRWK